MEMSIYQKQEFTKAVQLLRSYIQAKQYKSVRNKRDKVIVLIMPTGQEFCIEDVKTAEECLEYLDTILSLERLYMR